MILSLPELVVLGLATWRIGSWLHYGRGPLGIFAKIRGRLGVEHDEGGDPIAWPDTEFGRLLRCLDCGAIWLSAGLVGLYLLAPAVAIVLALPFALAAIASILQKAVNDG